MGSLIRRVINMKKARSVKAWGIKSSLGIVADTTWTRNEAIAKRDWSWLKIVRVTITEVPRGRKK